MENKGIYEHLLAQDPIGAFEKIKDDYKRYFGHAYRVNNEKLNKERIEKLSKDENLYKEPYLEMLPEYNATEGISGIEDLSPKYSEAFGSEDISSQFFSKFIKSGLMSYPPYGHQVGMLTEAFVNKKNVVITSGTGSGKTESFLLPLFAEIFKEAKGWPQPQGPAAPRWYEPKQYEPQQRTNENRPAALRALVLYPMNALVEDQMARLRKALDSDAVREFFDSQDGLNGNRIYFGRYTGATIGKKSYELLNNGEGGAELGKLREKVGEELRTLHDRFVNIKEYYESLTDAEEKKKKADALFVSTRLDEDCPTSEMVTRWDMQKTPPDIMITNTSMLSIMLMRKAEEDIFTKTKEWLQEDKRHVFHLIIDELHLYRGTSGSEVACLLRMLLDRIGLPPVVGGEDGEKRPNPQLRILASSASLGEKDETENFLEEFFGVYNDDNTPAFFIQKGDDYRPQSGGQSIDYGKFARITPEFLKRENDDKKAALDSLAKDLGCDSTEDFIRENDERIFADFVGIMEKNADKSLRPICYTDLYGKERSLFPNEESARGFLIFRGYADKLGIKHRLPRFRFHQFFKYIEGLWGELNPDTNNPVENLSYVPQEVGPKNRKVLELLRCECCGELFIGGNKKEGDSENGDNAVYLSLNYPELSHIPNFNPTPMVQNKSFDEYALFWPKHLNEDSLYKEDNISYARLNAGDDHVTSLTNGQTTYRETRARACWKHGYLNVNTGKFTSDRDENAMEGFLLCLKQEGNTQRYDPKAIQAMPCCCPKCGQDYRYRIYAKSAQFKSSVAITLTANQRD